MALFNDPVRGTVSYSPFDKNEAGAPVLVMGWDEESNRYLVCDAQGHSTMRDIDQIDLEWRWVPDRAIYPAATEYDRVADNWVQKTGPGWLDVTDMAEA